MSIKTSQIPQQLLPNGTVPLENQVAGHTFQAGTNVVGMLKDENDGTVLKPAGKPICGEREIKFYERLQDPIDKDLLALKNLVPTFYGALQMNISGKQVSFLKLSDLTHGMDEPCIMDIKIGKRTWDPLATSKKIAVEEEKYAACKKSLGACIPGFQLYSLTTGKIRRYGKEFGKQLTKEKFRDTLKMFLNVNESGEGMCKALLKQLLSSLWTIQKWSRSQTYYKLYSSSILLVYDARRLRNTLQGGKQNCNKPSGLTSTLSQASKNNISLTNGKPNGTENNDQPAIPVYQKVQRNHSAHNNYDEDLKTIRKNYVQLLDNLVGAYDEEHKEWAFAKMIDFAHAFPNDDDSIDTNYLFGVENLVKIFEDFLQECPE